MSRKALSNYLEDTQRPVYSALLVLPFLLIYEFGGFFLNLKVINGGDKLIRQMLFFAHEYAPFGPPLALLLCFLAWQWRTKASWEIRSDRVGWLGLESLGFALLLRFGIGWLAPHLSGAALPAAQSGGGLLPASPVGHIVLFCGAGVYEELVFRVLLLGLLMLVFMQLLHFEKLSATFWALGLGAVIFSLYHYIGPMGDDFTLNGFLQRSIAGLFFSALYLLRSFGVAAAAHAFYDLVILFSA
jgi:hypothetical protein